MPPGKQNQIKKRKEEIREPYASKKKATGPGYLPLVTNNPIDDQRHTNAMKTRKRYRPTHERQHSHLAGKTLGEAEQTRVPACKSLDSRHGAP